MDEKVIAYVAQNEEVDRGKYSIAPTQFSDRVIEINFDQQWDTVMSQGGIEEYIVSLIMANSHLLKKVVKQFDNHNKVTAIKELIQVHDMNTYTWMDPKKISCDQKNRAL